MCRLLVDIAVLIKGVDETELCVRGYIMNYDS